MTKDLEEQFIHFTKEKKTYSLICFANEIKDDERSDRVIATKWDAAFTYMMEFQQKKMLIDLVIMFLNKK